MTQKVDTWYQVPIKTTEWTLVRTTKNGKYEYITVPSSSESPTASVPVNANANRVSNTKTNKTAPDPSSVVKDFSGNLEIPQSMLRWLGVKSGDTLYVKFTNDSCSSAIIAKQVTNPYEYQSFVVRPSGRAVVNNSAFVLARKLIGGYGYDYSYEGNDKPSSVTISKNGTTRNSLFVQFH